MKKFFSSKSRLTAGAAALLTVLIQAKVVHLSPEQVQAILVLLGSGAVVGLRDAIDKVSGR